MNNAERQHAIEMLRAAAAKLTATKLTARPMAAYSLELDPREYRALQIMADRGYDGGLIENASEAEDTDDGGTILRFTESDAWAVSEAYEQDPDAFGTLASSSLMRKMLDFVDEIV